MEITKEYRTIALLKKLIYMKRIACDPDNFMYEFFSELRTQVVCLSQSHQKIDVSDCLRETISKFCEYSMCTISKQTALYGGIFTIHVISYPAGNRNTDQLSLVAFMVFYSEFDASHFQTDCSRESVVIRVNNSSFTLSSDFYDRSKDAAHSTLQEAYLKPIGQSSTFRYQLPEHLVIESSVPHSILLYLSRFNYMQKNYYLA